MDARAERASSAGTRATSSGAGRSRRWPAGVGRVELVLGTAVVALLALSPIARSSLWKWPVSAVEPPGAVTRLVGASPARDRLPEVTLLTEEGIRFYSTGQYPDACQRFAEALEQEQANAILRQNVARCFEGWGWQSLRTGKAEEAGLLFRQGLQQEPQSSPLLLGVALAAIHAGHPDEALEPLERAVQVSPDPEATVLLARLYDQRDQSDRAVAHLRRLLERDPAHPEAARLLRKLERERQAEAGYWKDESPHFVVKSRGAGEPGVRRMVLGVLEEVSEAVGREFRFFPGEKITVILYPDERFQEVTRASHWASGLFDGKIRLPVRTLQGRTRTLERLLTHEYTHAVVHLLSKGRAPRWLQEGLAQHAERVPDDPDLQISGGLTLAGLEALLSDGDLAKARMGYQVSLWVVRDLLERGGMERIRELLTRLGSGESAADALPRVYGLPLAELEAHWRSVLGG